MWQEEDDNEATATMNVRTGMQQCTHGDLDIAVPVTSLLGGNE
jgi:hypothetical protein